MLSGLFFRIVEQSHKSYRPLTVLTFRWNYAVHGLQPAGYHLVNLLLHALVSLLYYRVCVMFLPEFASFVAAILFAVHPIHTEAVTGVVGRAEMLSSVFFLGALLCYARAASRRRCTDWRYVAACTVCVGIAMLCKEQGITVTGVCVVYELFVAQKPLETMTWGFAVDPRTARRSLYTVRSGAEARRGCRRLFPRRLDGGRETRAVATILYTTRSMGARNETTVCGGRLPPRWGFGQSFY
ncbi:dolichyl-phosphate-mannose-protein mannosyltransferase domain-containing protein [Phthorimaea operculella]|nr:dolichyl-phosphate-mannose-protein mannosyltransferase domain-containing protein [Phthorimaea operculella]